jgi:curved DNA-binding protein CbpA
MNYYEVLGLAPLADGVMVDQAYWHLAKTYQAMAEADPRARVMLDELNEAYGVLGTPRLREEYDATLRTEALPPSGRNARRSHAAKPKTGWPFKLALPKFTLRQESSGSIESASVPPAAPPHENVQAARTAPANSATGKAKPNVTDLRASTARMLERWRTNAGIHPQPNPGGDQGPDMTLVDIFKTEKDLESREDPLAAVMDILKAPKDVVPTPTER